MKGSSRILVRLYRGLLLAYPREDRAECGREMLDTLEERAAAVRKATGRIRMLRFWCRELAAVVRGGLSLRWGGKRRERAQGYGSVVARPRRGFLDTLFQDLRFGLRTLRRRPLFTTVAVGTLGLGIGATTTIFALVEGVLLRPLPYERPGELVTIWQSRPAYRGHPIRHASWDRRGLSYPEYRDLREGTETFQDVALHGQGSMILTGSGDAELISAGIASSSLFPVLGVRPFLGRTFLPGEDAPGAERLVVLSYEIWRDRFGSDPEVIGGTIRLNQDPFTIIGVLPGGFRLTRPSMAGLSDTGARALWVPFGLPGTPLNRGNHSYEGIGRLAPGVTLEQARDETRALLPDDSGHPAPLEPLLAPRAESETRAMKAPLLLFLGAAALLLLIACGNVALLLTGEAIQRRHEMATRSSLGASRFRLLRQLVTESVLLGVLGAGLALLLAVVGTDALLTILPPFPRSEGVGMEPLVFLFAGGLGGLTGVVFGLAPFAMLRPRALGDPLRSRGGGSTIRGRRLQRALVAGQLALTTVLLVGGGLLFRSLSELVKVDPGFDAEGLVAARLLLSGDRFSEPALRGEVVREIVERAEALPGATAVTVANGIPFFDGASSESFSVVGRELDSDEVPPIARTRAILPGFHAAMGVSILAGRAFTPADGAEAPPVMIISEEMARRYWPDASPLGARVRWNQVEWTVVGIAGDVKNGGLAVEAEAGFKVPLAHATTRNVTLVVRSDGDPASLIPHLREVVRAVDPEIPLTRIASVREAISSSVGRERFATGLMTFFAVAAAILAVVGVFGMTSRGVAQRLHELGVRMALGAGRGGVVRLILLDAAGMIVVGVAVGVGLALLGSSLLQAALFGVSHRDFGVFLVTSLALGSAAVLASLIPARRATRVSPMTVLREE